MFGYRSGWLITTAILLGCGSSNTPLSESRGMHGTGGASTAAGTLSSGGRRGGGTGGGLGTGGITGVGGALGLGGISSAGGVTGVGGMSLTGGHGGTATSLDGQGLDGQMAVDRSCARNAIDASQAATIFRKHVMQVQPSMNPSVVFTATELAVPGLWDTLQAQVWNGKVRGEDGGYVRDCSFLYSNCALAFTDSADGGAGGKAIISGLVADGAFYYSWITGSGISYSLLGKLAPAGNTWLRTESMGYINGNLVVAPGEGKILVYRATSYWEKFNDWLNPEPLGTLKDFGDRLGILDSSGNELKGWTRFPRL